MIENNLPWDFYLTAAHPAGKVRARVRHTATRSLDAAVPQKRNNADKNARIAEGAEPGRTKPVALEGRMAKSASLKEITTTRTAFTKARVEAGARRAAKRKARKARKNAAVRQGLVEAREHGAQANHRPQLQGGEDARG